MSPSKADKIYTKEDLALFKEYYMTNKHCYAEQLPPNENGKARWNKVEGDKADFEDALVNHLDGEKTIGAYTIILNGDHSDCCKNCTFDFDISITDRKEMDALGGDKDEAFQQALIKLENKVREFLVFLNSIGVKKDMYLVSFSGYKGYHVDVFFESPIPTRRVYDFANALKQAAKLPAKLEVFPKQPTASASGSYGSLVKLPLGIHKMTNKRAKFIDLFDSDVNSLGTPFDFLRKTKRLTIDDINDIMSSVAESQLSQGDYSSNQIELKDLSQPPTNASFTKMINSCAALKKLCQKAEKEKHLLHEERMALLTLLIHFGDSGVAKLHEIISHCTDYSKEETGKMIRHARERKVYKPISCGKMQDMHICAKNCAEQLSRGGITPLKLAYSKAKFDIQLELVEEVEQRQIIGKVVAVPFKVDSLVGQSYSIPKEVIFSCSEGCPGRTGEKVECNHNNKTGEQKYIVPADSREILACAGAPEAQNKKTLLYCARIPCVKPNHLIMEVKSYHQVQPVMISSADDIIRRKLFESKFSMEMRNYFSYFVGENITTATDYMGIAKVHPHPKDQKTTYIISKVERLLGDLDEFRPSPEQIDLLKIYKNMNKAAMVHTIANKICGIHGRDREAMVVLLTVFSALQFEFNGRNLNRGWMETCFIGDSSQGKSKLPEEIMKYLGMYNMVSGSSTTVAGLIGGVDKHDAHQYISWGVLPNSDRTIAFLDEMEKLQKKSDALEALREIRSSGRAIINKIRKGSKACRVRLVASANPALGLSMDTYKRGCQAISSIMEPPDARRFDIFQFFFQDDVDIREVMKENVVDESYIEVSKEVMRMAVLWAWTRAPEDILISPDATRLILQNSIDLHEKYASSSIPIVTTDVKEKLARIAVASAMYHMRCDDDFCKVYVTIEDVELATKIMETTYGNKAVALDEESEECRRKFQVPKDWAIKFRREMQSHEIKAQISINAIIMHINTLDRVRAEEVALYLRLPRQEVSKLLQLMAVENLLMADFSGHYKPTPKMHRLARDLKHERIIKEAETSEMLSTEILSNAGGSDVDLFD